MGKITTPEAQFIKYSEAVVFGKRKLSELKSFRILLEDFIGIHGSAPTYTLSNTTLAHQHLIEPALIRDWRASGRRKCGSSELVKKFCFKNALDNAAHQEGTDLIKLDLGNIYLVEQIKSTAENLVPRLDLKIRGDILKIDFDKLCILLREIYGAKRLRSLISAFRLVSEARSSAEREKIFTSAIATYTAGLDKDLSESSSIVESFEWPN